MRHVWWGVLVVALCGAAVPAWGLERTITDGEGGTGVAVAEVGDADGAGGPDVAVGSDEVADGAGRVRIWLTDTWRAGAPALVIDGPAAGARAGAAIVGVGDVNGDGRADCAIGAPGADGPAGIGAGAVYVVFGAGAGTRALGALAPTEGLVLWGTEAGEQAGTALAVGDVDGDGRPELLVGAPEAGGGAGRVYVLGLAGLSAGGSGPLAARAHARISGPRGASLGDAVAAGELDGQAALLAGAPEASPLGRAGAGAVLGVPSPVGDRTLDVASAPFVLAGPEVGAGLGASLATGDLGGARGPDLAAGAPGIAAVAWAYGPAGGLHDLAADAAWHLRTDTDAESAAGTALAIGAPSPGAAPALLVGAPLAFAGAGALIQVSPAATPTREALRPVIARGDADAGLGESLAVRGAGRGILAGAPGADSERGALLSLAPRPRPPRSRLLAPRCRRCSLRAARRIRVGVVHPDAVAIARVQVNVVRLAGRRCAAYTGRRVRGMPCRRAGRVWVSMSMRGPHRAALRIRGLRAGRYRIRSRATDVRGVRETRFVSGRNLRRLVVR